MTIENIKKGLVKMLPLKKYTLEDVEKTTRFYEKAGYEVQIRYTC